MAGRTQVRARFWAQVMMNYGWLEPDTSTIPVRTA
jgi:hypothetical protein